MIKNFDIDRVFNDFIHTQNGSEKEWYSWCLQQETHHKNIKHGQWSVWKNNLDRLPETTERNQVILNKRFVSVDNKMEGENFNSFLRDTLEHFIPWRKGPYLLNGVEIDSEWRSDLKWDRLNNKIQPLLNRRVLDVGTGNGYHLWRMLGDGAKVAVGVEPTILSVAQFHAVARLIGNYPIWIIPNTLEKIDRRPLFDTVFSMGVLYHRRNPLAHLQELAECLRPGGELVLETLIVEGDTSTCLVPSDRYAGMRNVWFIPSIAMLLLWLSRLGYVNVRMVSCETTTPEEQRQTYWLGEKPSLRDVLDSQNPNQTIEGYPSPRRAIILAEKSWSSG
ncbi:tRNA 5-methoxyuridine(34)/uridine 5-oxyacetic acid(34) synthase CmoB [Halothiobacillus sp. DCM-1]|uniref:tRNA 5-methoxyuridine(34)/uridine 5-oxyacetic acid(34) synthase CmoB n=1 Tax=Halothiobacillus sp. DCM-1 TaxID=3112558 RepID=UPI00324B090F